MKKPIEFSPRMNVIQFRVLFRRYMRQIFSNPWTILPLLLEAPFMLIIISFVYEEDCFANVPHGLSAANTTLFLLALAPALMGLLNSYREICKEREILSREVFGGLDVRAYVVSKVVALGLIGAVQTLILVLGSLIFIDYHFENPSFSLFFFIVAVFMTNYTVTAIGLFISAVLKKSESAILPVLVVIIMQVVFAGSLLEFDAPVKYLYFFTPTMYGNSVLGNVAGMNAAFEFREIYGYNIYASCATLVLISLVCHTLTIIKLKRDYRTKD